ncbi:MAG: GIY-YIG nuclease family protein [Gammaproteobacteria bacterium]|nr:GIY-YIG nuclease family protein [Gammaproteobacteria bacterium]
MFWIYILRCSDNSYYTGHTDNLEKRINEHISGELFGYTHSRRPVVLVYSESFPTRYDALSRERQIKGWSRRKKEALIDGNWKLLKKYSKSSSPSTGSLRQAQGERDK